MSLSKFSKLVTGLAEGVLGIPIFGGLLIVSSGWTALWIMLALHIAAFVICSREKTSTTGSILGIATSVLGYIPILGMLMHMATAVVLLVSVFGSERSAYGQHRTL